MEKVRLNAARILRGHDVEQSNGNVVVMELIEGLRAMMETAQRAGPVTVADVETITLEIRRTDFLGPNEPALRIDFRMAKEVAQ